MRKQPATPWLSGNEINRREICTGCTAPRDTPAPPPGPEDTLPGCTARRHPRPGATKGIAQQLSRPLYFKPLCAGRRAVGAGQPRGAPARRPARVAPRRVARPAPCAAAGRSGADKPDGGGSAARGDLGRLPYGHSLPWYSRGNYARALNIVLIFYEENESDKNQFFTCLLRKMSPPFAGRT